MLVTAYKEFTAELLSTGSRRPASGPQDGRACAGIGLHLRPGRPARPAGMVAQPWPREAMTWRLCSPTTSTKPQPEQQSGQPWQLDAQRRCRAHEL